MTGHGLATNAPPAKRQKVDVACDLCRAKKVKCDSIRPVCGPCMKRKDYSSCCSWEGHSSRGQQPSRAEMLRLRRRVAELESQAENHRDKDKTSKSGEAHIDQNDIFVQETELAEPDPHTDVYLRGQNAALPISPALTQPSSGHPPSTERMFSEHTSMAIKSLTDNKHFFGGPSALSFINQIRNAVQQKLDIRDVTSLTNQEDSQMRFRSAAASETSKPLDYVLPGRRKADKLLSLYWDRIHPLYPFLDKQAFTVQYETLWVTQESSEDDPVFLCALNLIFAISSQHDENNSPNERQSSEDVFYQRAKENLDLWRSNSLHSVQALLLLSIYLQSSCALDQAWMIVGVAIRAAQSLGLHLCETSRRIKSHRGRELVRKVWHTCVLLDRMVSMTQGRPSMITARATTGAPMPVSIDEEVLPADDCLPMPASDKPSILAFFVQSLHLFEIFDDVLVESYSEHPETVYSIEETLEKFLGRTAIHNKRCILDIERKLLQWDRDLPSYLRIGDTSLALGNLSPFSRQAFILRQRYLHIRLLSMRPMLSAYLSSKSDGIDSGLSEELSLSARIVVQCSVVCVKIAQEMIELDYSRLPSDPNAVGFAAAWWHNVLYIYSAATVLVAARLSPSILSEIPEESILRSWSRAIDVLKTFQVSNPVIRRYVAALEVIYRVIPDRYHHSKHQSHRCLADAGNVPSLSSRFESDKQVRRNPTSPNASPLSEEALGSLGGQIWDDCLEGNLLFDTDDLSWLNVMPL